MRVVPKYGDLHEDWPQECRGNCDVIKSYSFLINISPWSGATGKETSKEGAAGEGAGGGGGRGGGGGASILSAGPSRAPLSSSSSLRSSPPHSNLNNSFGRAGGEGSLIRSRRRDIRSSSSPFFRFLRFFDFIYFSTERVLGRVNKLQYCLIAEINLPTFFFVLFFFDSIEKTKIGEYVFKVYLSELLLRGPLGRDFFNFAIPLSSKIRAINICVSRQWNGFRTAG